MATSTQITEAIENLERAVELLTSEAENMNDSLPRRRLMAAIDAAARSVASARSYDTIPGPEECLHEFIPHGLDYLD